jgi:hypothetical protein
VGKTLVRTGDYAAPSANYTVTQPTLSADIRKVALMITGITIADKEYDGTTTARISGTAAYSGLVSGETFSVTGTPVATFGSASVATGKAVTVSGYTVPSDNYSLTQPSGLKASITAKALTVGTPVLTKSKPYDGNNTVAGAVTVGTPNGKVGTEDVSVTVASATYDTAAVGTGKQITVVYSLTGSAKDNYSVPGSTVLYDGVITAVGTTFASWSDNATPTPDLIKKYAFGALNKSSEAQKMTSSIVGGKLILTAVVRTDDTLHLTITAKTATSLSGSWSTSPTISVADASDQSGFSGVGLVRKDFKVDCGSDTKRFLKLEAVYTP